MRPHPHSGLLVWIVSCAVLGGCAPVSIELFDGGAASPDAATDGAVSLDASLLSQRDPERCGAAAVHCEDDEYCVAGACICRETLVRIGERCVDPDSDPAHCGPSGSLCSEACSSGLCVPECPAGTTSCEDACVDTDRHPLHCGECGRPCGSADVCIGGLCREFQAVETCAECGGECCSYPTRPADLICVQHDTC